VRAHLAQVHADYVQKFNELVERAGQQQDA
jgi:hypothetical protein